MSQLIIADPPKRKSNQDGDGWVSVPGESNVEALDVSTGFPQHSLALRHVDWLTGPKVSGRQPFLNKIRIDIRRRTERRHEVRCEIQSDHGGDGKS